VPLNTVAIPEMDFRRVLFPEPFGPTMTVIFPGSASRETPLRTWSFP
jgi:hypothetical protein